jgi:hypothetical protein
MSNFDHTLRISIAKAFLLLTFLLASSFTSLAAGWTQRQKVTSTPRGVGAEMGYSVAVSGDTMVVGARHDSTTAAQAGAAFVFVLSGTTWTQQAVLLANDGAASDEFGYSVAISDNTIVVGAFHDDSPLSNAGSAYVFVRSGATWTFQQKLTANDQTADDLFGNAVAAEGDTIVVGAYHADLPSNSEAGSAYRYTRSGTVWSQVQRLLPVQGPNGVLLGDHFGSATAMSGGKVAIGASGDDNPFTAAGAVYVFALNGGTYSVEQKLTIASGTNGDSFGGSVAIEGNMLVGGATENSGVVGQSAIGAAYAFEFNGSTWQSQGRLVASDRAGFDRFGWSVGVSDGVIAVGARGDTTAAGSEAGSTYIFNRSGSTWTEMQKLTPGDPLNGDRFGASVALSFGNLLIGAVEKQLTSPNGQGAVYYFRLLQGAAVRFDYDGDGKADISIYRPANGQWWYQQSSNDIVRAASFGVATDKPVPADFDGDGKTDIAIYRPSTGEWFVLRSSNTTFFSVPFGISSDKPAPADFDGDGLANITVFRASEGTWYISISGGVQISQWGRSGDVPVNADYDADGRSDLAIYRPSDGSWWINRSTEGTFITTFGVGSDKPIPADYTGDGKTDIGVWRPSSGNWYILRSEDYSFYAFPFGATGDIPTPADFDGDGRADYGVFRPDGANWFIARSTAGILIQQFGATGDVPTESAFIP